MLTNLSWETKDPQTTLDYIIDWTQWLGSDTLSTVTFVVDSDSGLVIERSSFTARTSTVILSGGTPGKTGYITCTVTTVNGLTGETVVHMLIR